MAKFTLPDARNANPQSGDDSSARTGGAALIEALESQLALYEQLNSLSHRQGSLIGVEDGGPLLELISQRQNIIDDLQALQRDFESRGLASAALDDAQRREASELHELIAATRARILEQDERDRAALRDARNQVGDGLRKLSSTGKAARAYGGGIKEASAMTPVISRFTDKQG